MSSSKVKYYAVRVGLNPGIYNTWEECLKQVHGFEGAIYKSFKTLAEANEFLNSNEPLKKSIKPSSKKETTSNDKINEEVESKISKLKSNEAIAFVDGSYIEDKDSKIVGFGVVILNNGNTTKLSGVVTDSNLLEYRNVTGEIYATKNAILWGINNNIKTINIYYDYEGIKSWAKRLWKANNDLTKGYVDFISKYEGLITIKFNKVKAHSGIIYNEMVDKIASDAINNSKK